MAKRRREAQFAERLHAQYRMLEGSRQPRLLLRPWVAAVVLVPFIVFAFSASAPHVGTVVRAEEVLTRAATRVNTV